ncbi:hypothetical protein BMW22_08820 [Rhizobium leguminosarum]|uniref:Transposase n=1 Tax=Rhizobium leguminosarum TaxID=384 RepID=A0A1L3Z7R4_RHILE|nr:hypothetical protein BMW22_08820 [Rhizobium leguminosarum]
MGLIAMSERDLQRIEVLSKVVDGRATLVSAARVLGLSERKKRVFQPRGRRDCFGELVQIDGLVPLTRPDLILQRARSRHAWPHQLT